MCLHVFQFHNPLGGNLQPTASRTCQSVYIVRLHPAHHKVHQLRQAVWLQPMQHLLSCEPRGAVQLRGGQVSVEADSPLLPLREDLLQALQEVHMLRRHGVPGLTRGSVPLVLRAWETLAGPWRTWGGGFCAAEEPGLSWSTATWTWLGEDGGRCTAQWHWGKPPAALRSWEFADPRDGSETFPLERQSV